MNIVYRADKNTGIINLCARVWFRTAQKIKNLFFPDAGGNIYFYNLVFYMMSMEDRTFDLPKQHCQTGAFANFMFTCIRHYMQLDLFIKDFFQDAIPKLRIVCLFFFFPRHGYHGREGCMPFHIPHLT